MNIDLSHDFFSFQPFWEATVERTALVKSYGQPLAMLWRASSDINRWDTIPGLGNMIFTFCLNEHDPHVICTGLHQHRKTTSVPCTVDKNGQYHFLWLRIAPGHFSRLFHENTSEFNEKHISLDDFLPNSNIALQMIEARDFESQVEIVARFLGELEKKSPLGLKDEISLAANQLLLSKHGNISITELGRELCYSSRYLHSVMRERLGVCPKEQCKNIRMQNALKMLLSSSQLSIEQISQELGYYDASHFVHAYADFIGESPTMFRQKYYRRERHPLEIIL